MPATEDKRLRCIVCNDRFYPNRYWQRYCSAYCCTEFHRRERQQMMQWWKQQQAQQEEFVDHFARINAEIETAQAQSAEPMRRRL